MAKKVKFKKPLLDDTKKGFLINLAVKQLMAFLISKLSWFAGGPLGWLATKLVTKGITLAIEHTVLGINNLVIDIRVGKKAEKLEEVRKKVHLITEETTEEELDALDKEIEDAAADLIKFHRGKL